MSPQHLALAWSALFVGAYLLWRDGRGWLRRSLAGPRLGWMLALSGVLIAFNWGLYIWAVNAGHVVETALGYFINPLLNVLIGVLFLRERLRPLQWLSVAVAAAGVLWLAVRYGQVPWIALALAASFGLYGVVRKLAHVDAVAGLGVESAYLFLPAIALLAWTDLAQILPADADRALGRWEQPQQQFDKGGLAATRSANDRHRLTRLNDEAAILQHPRLTFRITEPQAFNLDPGIGRQRAF